MTRPLAVLDMQADLIRWYKSVEGIAYLDLYGRDKDSFTTSSDAGREFVEINWPKRGALAAQEVAWLNRCVTYRVEPEMVDLVNFASRSMKQQNLDFTDLPVPNGFAWLEKPYVFPDIQGVKHYIRVVAWNTVNVTWAKEPGSTEYDYANPHSGIIYRLFDDFTDQTHTMWREYRKWKDEGSGVPRLSLMHMEPWTFGVPFEVFDKTIDAVFDSLTENDEHFDLDGLLANASTKRWLATFWALIQQKVPNTFPHPADRALRRRLAREHLTLPSEVQVVTLRKTRYDRSSEPTEPEETNWTHRWWVGAAEGGHWHTYHTKDGPKQRWVLPYIKGPEDRPLIEKDAVLNWRR